MATRSDSRIEGAKHSIFGNRLTASRAHHNLLELEGPPNVVLGTDFIMRRLLDSVFAKHDADVRDLKATIGGLELRLEALDVSDTLDRSAQRLDIVPLERESNESY